MKILIDERHDGVHLSYDRMACLLAPYGSTEAFAVARDLDSKSRTCFENVRVDDASVENT